MKKQYVSYQQTLDFLNQAVAKHPDFLRLETIGQTHEGRPIVLVTLSQNIATADYKPALLYTGTIHAREWIGIELAVGFLKYILSEYPTNPQIMQALSRNTLYMVPCLNPDGFEYSRQHFSFWRKNRRNNGDGTFGVDLNRNFSTHFRRTSDTRSNIYSGPCAFSEPETRAIRDFVEQHTNITTALDYHSQGNVFFPAHKFNHEAEIEGTDLNIFCANMANIINQISGRQYGIHRGKPPANLIHGSGREYYYERGILSTVVEVGTRNIPDYLLNMTQHIDENIPVLLYALNHCINYSALAPSRPHHFNFIDLSDNHIVLTWQDEQYNHNHFYEIYRSENPKAACTENNLIAVTAKLTHTDKQLKSGKRYFYNLRKVDHLTQIKSPFAPELRIKTPLNNENFSYTLFPQRSKAGYVGEFTRDHNSEHFGVNSLFIGINQNKGICYGVLDFDLVSLPADICIRQATLSLYPMNRVGSKIENYGEWSVSILNHEIINDSKNFDQIHHATPLQTLGDAIGSDQLTQGIWRNWQFSDIECQLLDQQLQTGRLILRIQGPTELPLGNDSQMMQFDLGYGRFGGGLHYRPNLEIIYTKKSQQRILSPQYFHTVEPKHIHRDVLETGFNSENELIFSQLAFSLNELPENTNITITQAYFEIQSKSINTLTNPIRLTIEIAELENNEVNYNTLLNRQKKEYLGYEVSSDTLKTHPKHVFLFDSSARQHLEQHSQTNAPLHLIVRATSASKNPNSRVEWHTQQSLDFAPKLVIEYIERRQDPVATVTDLTAHIDNGVVKLSWKNPKDRDFVGCFVIRNSFHPPRSPFDGVKLYAGQDEYTYDSFGNPNIEKYYAVFTYDNVPNYSQPLSLHYSSNEVIPIEYEEFEAQDDWEQRHYNGD